MWPVYGIDFSDHLLDLDQVFDRNAPRTLDIGAGSGDATIALADAYRENDYLAVEVHRPGVGSLLHKAGDKGLGNIRVICHDVIDVLERQIRNASLDQVFMFFPDPWPKKRHHKRRLVRPLFLDLLAKKLRANGRFYIATDWPDLAGHILEICDGHRGFCNLAGKGNQAPRPLWRPLTRFELRGESLQHPVYDFIYALSNDTGHGNSEQPGTR